MSKIMSVVLLLTAATSMAYGIYDPHLPKPETEARHIAGGYAAYTATITAVGAVVKPADEGARPRRPVTLRVNQILTGSHVKPGDLIIRDYVEPGESPRVHAPPLDLDAARKGRVQKYTLPPPPEYSVAWEGVPPRVGAKLLILDAGVGRTITAAEADDSSVAAKLRRLIEFHERRDLNALAHRAEILRPNHDSLDTFYVINAVPSRLPPDMAADTLMTLIEKRGFTAAQYFELLRSFTLKWAQCTEPVKTQTLKRLAHVAARPDDERARPALTHLLVMRSSDGRVGLPQLESAVARQLRVNYERLVASGFQRDAAFEASLNRMAGAR